MANQLPSILMQTRHSALNGIILNGVMQLSKHQVALGQRCFSFIELFLGGFDNLRNLKFPPESDAAGGGVTPLRELPMGKGDKAAQRSWVRNPALPGLALALHRALAAPGMVSCGSWDTQEDFWPWCFDGGLGTLCCARSSLAGVRSTNRALSPCRRVITNQGNKGSL